jgi:hypothetical protein
MIKFRSNKKLLFPSFYVTFLLALLIGCGSFSVNPIAPFNEDFTGDLRYWNLFGDPQPKLIPSFKGRNGIFDNNGDPNYPSGVISKEIIKSGAGYTIRSEVYVDFTNLSGCWASASIGLTEVAYPNGIGYSDVGQEFPRGAVIAISSEGEACWGTPAEFRKHSWVYAGIYAEDGQGEGLTNWTINADKYTNGWHTLQIAIQPDRTVKFFIDGDLLWQPTKKIHPSVLEGSNIVLGARSSGSAGKTYHDWISVTK